jgi:PPK2 family polyphosphate:nucleotide phosphotransferase
VINRIRVEPGHKPKLAERDPRDTLGLAGKEEAKDDLAELVAKLERLQGRLYAESRRSILLVLQGLDASGKDGVIRAVFEGVNPQGCRVVGFKAPTSTELAHDYLWRIHSVLPERGYIGIFNRSQYEDVIAVRMLDLAPKEVWSRRPGHINEFERMLTDEGTTVVKVFLHVSKDEQAQRFRERIADPDKQWKFRKADLDVHAKYDDYMAAYEDLLEQTSTVWAPWHVVPADRNWVKAHAVATLLVQTLEKLDPQFPAPEAGIQDLRIE